MAGDGVITAADVVDFRRRLNLSRKRLAEMAGLTEGKMWRIENKGNISADEMRALELLGVLAVTTAADAGLIPPLPPREPVVPSVMEWKNTTTPEVEAAEDTQPVMSITEPEPPQVDFAELVLLSERAYDRFFSNSELQTFKRCRRKWWLSWYRGLHLIREPAVGVRQIGNRLHRALKEHYQPEAPPHKDHLLEALERNIVVDRSLLGEVSDEVRKQFEDEANLERIMLEGYLEWLAETGADSELEIIAPETYLEAGLSEFDDLVAIIGKLDVRVRRKTDDVQMFIDHKSVGDLRTPTLMLPLDEQMLHYHLLEELNLKGDGQRTGGALYNMLRRVKRTARATPPFYQRVEVRHNEYELQSFRRRVVGLIQDIRDVEEQLAHGASHLTVAYPTPRRDCTWDCPFLPVCPMFDDGSRAEDMLSQYYEKGDPLQYYLEEMLHGTE